MRIVTVFAWLALATAVRADSLPAGFTPSMLNASIAPVVEARAITFHIIPGDCSSMEYGNGSGENDCLNGGTKNIIRYESEARLGDTVEYKFDVWVDPAFSYNGFSQAETIPFGGLGWDSRLRIASWEGPQRKNFIDMLKLDSKNGMAFRFRQCQAPSDFGSWVTFSMQVRWANDERGWLKVTCNDRVVAIAEGVVTNEQPHCYFGNECDPSHPTKNARRILFQLGLAMNGWGQNWKDLFGPTNGPFTVFDKDGLIIKMRNISVTEGVELYGGEDKEVVKQLQARLNHLGTPDGVVGKRTKAAALSCRERQDLPSQLDVTTVRKFLELYSAVEG